MIITRKSAREILAYIAIRLFLRAVHQDLRTIIKLWNTIDGKQKSKSLLQGKRILTIAQESVCIMILNKCHHARWVGIQIVIAERVIQAIKTVPPGIGLLILCLIQLIKEREVHYCLQIGIPLREFRVLLPSSSIGRFCHPCLTNSIEVGILIIQLLHPLCHSISVCVWIGIHTYSIDSNSFNPPDTVLYKIAHKMWIMLVEVRH